ncbi:MAG TPA: hypothetical protein VME66_11750 [Candidatus Acidoferrales bacterium]|nr:hypothetical protein [Candidatus Acidoferrales bacterium]
MTVRATFSFTNLGGGPAKGLRVRFSLPEGLTYLVDSGHIDATPLDSLAGVGSIVNSSGVDIGDVEPGSERRLSLAYVVAPTIENDSVIELQAAISSFDIPVIGSNIVRLIVRAKPKLQNDKTGVSITPVRDTTPGSELIVAARIQNSGESSANGVVLVMPTPIGTTYVPGTIQIDGVDFDDQKRREPFGHANPVTVASKLGPGATLNVQYRARIDALLGDGTPIVARASVGSREISEFDLPIAMVPVTSLASFDGDETRFEVVRPDGVPVPDEIGPGQHIQLRLLAHNTGTSVARDVTAQLDLPAGLTFARGSLRVDGQAFPDREKVTTVALGDVEAHASTSVEALAVVTSPAPNGRTLPITAKLRWSTGTRSFDRSLVIASEPRFSPSRTRLTRLSPPVLEPGETAHYLLTLLNDGTTVAEPTATFRFGETLQDVEVREAGDARTLSGATLALGPLEPQMPRALTITGTVCSPIADGTDIHVGVSLSAPDCASLDLEAPVTQVRSRPRFVPSSSYLRLQTNEALRPDRVCAVLINLRNEGNDRARGVRVALRYSPELRLETVEGATRDGSQIVIGDIEPGETHQATVHLRLVHLVPRGFAATVDGSVVGRGLPPIILETTTITTTAEPNFSDGATLVSSPRDAVDAGAELGYTLALRNTGDGAAQRLVIKVQRPNSTAYVPCSTSVNGVALQDQNGTSLLWSDQGLALTDVAPGVEIIVGWLAIVNTPLPADTVIRTKAEITYDNGGSYTTEAAPIVVRSAPAFPVTSTDLPFSVAGAAAYSIGAGSVERLPGGDRPMRRVLALTPNANEKNDVIDAAPLEGGVVLATPPERNVSPAPALQLVAEFSPERLDRTLRFLDEADFGALLTHLFALRAFFPDVSSGSAHLDTLLEAQRVALRNTLDRLFVTLRLPRFKLSAKELESQASRDATWHLLAGLADERSVRPIPESTGAARMSTTIDSVRSEALAKQVADAPLGGAAPWYALAHLLGESLDYGETSSTRMGIYRNDLIETLGAFTQRPVTAFHKALTSERFPHLDAALRDVLHLLRVPADATT